MHREHGLECGGDWTGSEVEDKRRAGAVNNGFFVFQMVAQRAEFPNRPQRPPVPAAGIHDEPPDDVRDRKLVLLLHRPFPWLFAHTFQKFPTQVFLGKRTAHIIQTTEMSPDGIQSGIDDIGRHPFGIHRSPADPLHCLIPHLGIDLVARRCQQTAAMRGDRHPDGAIPVLVGNRNEIEIDVHGFSVSKKQTSFPNIKIDTVSVMINQNLRDRAKTEVAKIH